MNNTHLDQLIFWLYYAKGLLQAKLKQHNDAIGSFTASVDHRNYAKALNGNKDLVQEEIANHKQILKNAENTINNKARSSDDIVLKSGSDELLKKYQQITNFFEQVVVNQEPLQLPEFKTMFDIPLVENNIQNKKLKYGYSHYHKGLSELTIQKTKKALKSFNEANKLLPEFCLPYIQKANIYRDSKKYIKAASQYDAAIRLDANNAELYFNRSMVLFELGKPLEAKNDFNTYQSLNSAKS